MDQPPEDDIHLSEELDSRSDIADLRPLLKQRAEAMRNRGQDVTVEDLLALTRKNDTAYISPADVEKAEWFADLYERVNEKYQANRDSGDLDARDVDWTADDDIRLSPRTLHYIVAGDATLRDGQPYENTDKCYGELKTAAFWAQVLGLVDPEAIRDGNNNAPQGPAVVVEQHGDGSGGRIVDPAPDRERPPGEAVRQRADRLRIDTGYRRAQLPDAPTMPSLKHSTVSEVLHAEADRLVEAAFERVRWDEYAHQDYYIEIWCEKSGVIPQSLSEEYGVTRRAAGQGEMSYAMAREAIDTAEARGQDLVVIIVSDHDPKGSDMPRSVSRKLELEAAFHDCEAFVHHAAVTQQQAREYGLRTTPAKEASGERDNPGRVAYESHKDTFEAAAGQDPVEVNAFAGDHPAAFRLAIEQYIEPYFDAELHDRLREATRDAKERAHQRLVATFRDDVDDAHEAYADLGDGIAEYRAIMGEAFDELEEHIEHVAARDETVREDLDLEERRDAVKEAIGEAYREELAAVGIDRPNPRVEGRDDALLDSRRGFFEQLAHYDDHDPRTDAE
jgi:hypothetical protein